MITVQRSATRRYVKEGTREMWMSFDGAAADPRRRGFRALGAFNEVKLRPGAEFEIPPEPFLESLTYVREGGLMVRRRPRREEILPPGCYERTTARYVRIAGTPEAARLEGAHLFVGALKPPRKHVRTACDRALSPFSERRGVLRLIAAGSDPGALLQLQADVRLYSSALDPGHHLVHEIAQGRGAWLHVVTGKLRLVDHELESGDGVALEGEPSVSFTAQQPSEILLFDLA